MTIEILDRIEDKVSGRVPIRPDTTPFVSETTEPLDLVPDEGFKYRFTVAFEYSAIARQQDLPELRQAMRQRIARHMFLDVTQRIYKVIDMMLDDQERLYRHDDPVMLELVQLVSDLRGETR